MSGGHFGYIQDRVNDVANELDRMAGRTFSQETYAKFALAADTVRAASKMIHRIDWLVSYDDGEDSFHRRWAEDGLPEPDVRPADMSERGE